MMDTATPHLNDAQLLALSDRDGEQSELEGWATHVTGCAECKRKLEVLRRRSLRFSALVADLRLPEDFPLEPPIGDYPASTSGVLRGSPGAGVGRQGDPTRRGPTADRTAAARVRTPWLRIAAAILILAVPVLAIEPLRTAVGDWIGEQWTWLAGGDTPEQAGALEIPAVPTGSTIYFMPEAGDFVVTFAEAEPEGFLSVTRRGGTEGALEIEGGTATPIIVPGGLRISNAGAVGAAYHLELPASVRTLRVVVGGRSLAPVVLPEPGHEVQVRLRG
jgi:hypothetical protein